MGTLNHIDEHAKYIFFIYEMFYDYFQCFLTKNADVKHYKITTYQLAKLKKKNNLNKWH